MVAVLVLVVLFVGRSGDVSFPHIGNGDMFSGGRSDLSTRFSRGKCEGSGAVVFTTSPVALADLEYIEPMGAMSGEHVTPTDHQYWRPPAWSIEPKPRDVLAPADGTIVEIEEVFGANDFRMIIEHSCTFCSLYIHITELDPVISRQAGSIELGSSSNARIPVAEGQRLGTIYGRPNMRSSSVYQLDFSVADTEVKLSGLVNPASYDAEPWKIHAADPWLYFEEQLREQLLTKNLRTESPLGGRIDYDVAGRLAGNWFRSDVGGYNPNYDNEYWLHHLTFAYDHIDPATVKISIGDWQGKPQQFQVKGNGPDPADVSRGSGLVKYELQSSGGYIDQAGRPWDQSQPFARGLRTTPQGQRSDGVVLVQLLDDQQLKVEKFPNQRAASVAGFTNAAEVYVR